MPSCEPSVPLARDGGVARGAVVVQGPRRVRDQAAGAKRARVIAVDPWWQRIDPTHVVNEFHHGDPDDVGRPRPTSPLVAPTLSGCRVGRSYEQKAQAAIEPCADRQPQRAQVARRLARHAAQSDATIMVSASMPIRDLEWFAPPLPESGARVVQSGRQRD